MRRIAPLMLLIVVALGGRAQDRTLPSDPQLIQIVSVTGRGVQIYRYSDASPSMPAWVFSAPEAILYLGDQRVGSHGAGPAWHWKDGSGLTGKMKVSQPSPAPDAIPWLLVDTSPAAGSRPGGMLGEATYVRRSDTHGGVAPKTGCDAHHVGTEVRVPYTATYTFYKPANRP